MPDGAIPHLSNRTAAVSRCRIVVLPVAAPRWYSRRWEWSVERDIAGRWEGRERGRARSCMAAFRAAARKVGYATFRDHRLEAIVVREQSYPAYARPSRAEPLEAQVLVT